MRARRAYVNRRLHPAVGDRFTSPRLVPSCRLVSPRRPSRVIVPGIIGCYFITKAALRESAGASETGAWLSLFAPTATGVKNNYDVPNAFGDGVAEA